MVQTDVTFALKTSILPDGDVFGGAMAEVVEDATSHWTDDDRAAVAEYLFTVPPLADEPAPPTKKPRRTLNGLLLCSTADAQLNRSV